MVLPPVAVKVSPKYFSFCGMYLSLVYFAHLISEHFLLVFMYLILKGSSENWAVVIIIFNFNVSECSQC